MNILIAYTTTEGQTRKIAKHAARFIEKHGHSATLFEREAVADAPDIAAYDAVILAASVHNKRFQTAMYDFVAAHRPALEARPLAFISVSLAVTLADGEAEAQSYVEDFKSETGLAVKHVHFAEGAVRYTEYAQSEASTINLVVFKGQKRMPPKGSNPEYTDWAALEGFLTGFLAAAQ